MSVDPSKDEQPRELVLTDPRAMRAVAHEVRQQLLDLFDTHELLTATEAAKAVGVSPSAMSYHLRALEKWGIVTRGGQADDSRARPWRMVARNIRFSPGPNVGADSHSGRRAVMATFHLRIESALARAGESDRGGHYVANGSPLLTDDELTQVCEALDAALAPYEDRVIGGADTPHDAKRRSVFFLAVSEDEDAQK